MSSNMAAISKGNSKTACKANYYLLKLKAVRLNIDPHNLPKNQRTVDTNMWPGIRFPCTQCHHRGNIQREARCHSKASMLPQSHFVIITETVETVAEKFQQTITGKSFTFF